MKANEEKIILGAEANNDNMVTEDSKKNKKTNDIITD